MYFEMMDPNPNRTPKHHNDHEARHSPAPPCFGRESAFELPNIPPKRFRQQHQTPNNALERERAHVFP